jgi:glycosyltransferase involved in cell wall biosynthesis
VLPVEPSWLRAVRAFEPHAVLVSQGSAYECVARSATRPLLRWLANPARPVRFVNLVQFNRSGVKRNWRTQRHALRFYQAAAANLFVCRRNITEASDWLGVPVPRAQVVCNPANLSDTAGLPWPVSDDEGKDIIRLACVARLDVAVKGQDVLLRALAQINDPRVRLTVAGAGPDRDTLRELARQLGLQGVVHFAGQIADVRALWASHHMLVLASHSEGTPLAMIEAMLLGRPVVVTDVGGCSDWVTYGREGWIAASPTVDHVGAALRAALAEHARLPEAGGLARARAVGLHDPHAGRTVLRVLTPGVE